jgi:hypothetical protein
MFRKICLFVATAALVAGCSSTPPAGPDAGSSTSAGSASTTGASSGTGSTGAAGTGGASTGAATAGSSGGSTGGISAATACADYANGFCTLWNSCSNGTYITETYGTVSACVAAYEAQCTARLAIGGGSALTPTQVESCAQAVPGEACADLYDGNDTSPCLAAQGQEATGSGCGLSAQCQTAYCALPNDGICGTCAAKPGAGSDCSVDQCAPGYNCVAATKTCEVPEPDGGACSVQDDCLFGFSCIGAATGSGYCAPSAALGGACSDKLGPRGCDSRLGLVCTGGDGGVCAAAPFASANQPCGDVPGAVGTDCTDSVCFKPDGGKEGTCLADAPDGQPCDPVNGPKCLPFSRCVGGTCEALYSSSCNGAGTTSGGTTGGGSTGGGTTGGSTGATTGGNATLLVDNAQNSTQDPVAFFEGFLSGAGLAYDLAQVAADGSNSGASGTVPSASQLASHANVIWFTGDDASTDVGTDQPLSGAQESLLLSWLDSGNKTLVIFSEELMLQLAGSSFTSYTIPPSDPLFSTYLPLQGGEEDLSICEGSPCSDDDVESLTSYAVTGGDAFVVGTWSVTNSPVTLDASAVNPAVGVDTLLTMQADPNFDQANITTAVGVGVKGVGAAHTSTVVYVGIPIENVQINQQTLFNDIVLDYAGL